MKIRIPHSLVRAWIDFCAWGDEPAWVIKGNYRHNMITIRRIDIVIAAGGVACTMYYWVIGGWQGALLGGALYILGVMTALWIL